MDLQAWQKSFIIFCENWSVHCSKTRRSITLFHTTQIKHQSFTHLSTLLPNGHLQFVYNLCLVHRIKFRTRSGCGWAQLGRGRLVRPAGCSGGMAGRGQGATSWAWQCRVGQRVADGFELRLCRHVSSFLYFFHLWLVYVRVHSNIY
jgi:hypothetical protein